MRTELAKGLLTLFLVLGLLLSGVPALAQHPAGVAEFIAASTESGPDQAYGETGDTRGGSEVCGDCARYAIMRPDRGTRERWIAAYNEASRARIDRKWFRIATPAGSFDLLEHLAYTPGERSQGACGNCWAWAGTGVMEIALSVQEGIKDRLSVQYINSCQSAVIDKACCAGGWLSDFADFYDPITGYDPLSDGVGRCIPWANGSAHWQSGGGSCGPPCGSVSTTPGYPISAMQVQVVPTLPPDGVTDQATAIANIKDVLNQNKAVWFGFFLPNSDAWDDFEGFWRHGIETDPYDMDQFCGIPYDDSPDEGGGHAVLCVGYNDEDPDNPYWIMLNSWGSTSGRPNGLFRVNMDMDYQCVNAPDPSFYWQTLDVAFDVDGATYPTRELPYVVRPGEEFDVTVTFTSPAADFNAIELTDVAPSGWSVTVNAGWPSPAAQLAHKPVPDEAVYTWFGPYAAGVEFTAVYKVGVPASAVPGTYTFPGGTLEYYTGGTGPYVATVAGKAQVMISTGTTVSIDAPAVVAEGSEFIARVAVDHVQDFNSVSFDVVYDQTIITVTAVTGGEIDGNAVAVGPTDWSYIPAGPDDTGRTRVIAAVPGIPGPGITGSGHIAQIHFRVLGSGGHSSDIALQGLAMYDYLARSIPTTTIDGSVQVGHELDEDWLVNLSLTTDPHIGNVPGPGSAFAFGARDGATEGYDPAEGDQIAPPDPMIGINSCFYYPDNPALQRNLITSVAGPGLTITWPLRVKSIGDPGATQATLTWDAGDIGNVPARYTVLALRDTAGNILANMRTNVSYTFPLLSNETRDFYIVAEEVPTYSLAMAASPAPGGTATDLTSGSPYTSGTQVSIRAVAAAGYRFVNWTAPAGAFGNANAAETTFTMPAQAVTVTAHFAAVDAEDWLVNLSLTTTPHIGNVPGPGSAFAFGARAGATQGYSEAEGDQIAPPDPMIGINSYFYYPDNPALERNLITSVVGPAATIAWPLLLKSVGDPGTTQATLTWDVGDIAGVPEKYGVLELRDTAGTTLANMRTVASYTFALLSNETKNFHIVAEEVPTYALTMAVAPPGSGTAVDLSGASPYAPSTGVHIKAQAAAGYRFVHWTAPAGVFVDAYAQETIFIMPPQAVTVTANFETVTGEGWLVNLRLTTDPDIGSLPGTGYGFAFGARDGATQGYSEAEGDQIAPPDPMAGITAYFYYPDNPVYQRNLITSVVGPAAAIAWPLLVKSVGDPGATEATLTWDAGDIGHIPAGYGVLELRDAAGNTLADMRAGDSYTFALPSGGTRTFHIVAGEQVCFVYDLKAGWNMVSLPLHTQETSPGELFPEAIAIYAWNPVTLAYDLPTKLVSGQGYWVLYMNDATRTICGLPVRQYGLADAPAGWHMIGSLWVDAHVGVQAGNVLGSFYWWNPETPSFDATATVAAGRGYWLLGFTDFSISVVPVSGA